MHHRSVGLSDSSRRRAREERVQAIVDAARVRRELGQGAGYELVGGVHVVTHRGRRVRGGTLAEAIGAAMTRGG